MSKLFKRKNSPYWWWTGRYKGARYRRSTKMAKERLAQKVKDHWDLNLMLDKLEFLGPSFNKSITIEKFIWNHLIFLSKRKSDDTVYTAKYVLGQFCSYCNSQKVKFINQITIKLIDGYIESMTCSPKTKKNYVGVISRMLNEAVKDDLIIKNPAKFFNMLIFQFINPKAVLFAIIMVSTFISTNENFIRDTIIVVSVAFIFSFVSIFSWCLLGKFLRRFATNEKFIQAFNYVMSFLLIVCVIMFYL